MWDLESGKVITLLIIRNGGPGAKVMYAIAGGNDAGLQMTCPNGMSLKDYKEIFIIIYFPETSFMPCITYMEFLQIVVLLYV